MYTISRGALLKKTILVLFAVAITLTLAFSGTGAVACAAETAETADSDFEAGKEYRVPLGESYSVYQMIDGVEVLLFDIPESYYFTFNVSNKGKNYISYNGITKSIYIKNTDAMALTDKDTEPRGGFSLDLRLKESSVYYRIDDFIYAESLEPSDTLAISFVGFCSKYVHDNGSVLNNAAFVKVGNSYGFIDNLNLETTDGEALSTFIGNVPLHVNYRPATDTGDDSQNKAAVDNNKLTRIILIVGIVVPAIIIVLLLFKPSKKNRYDYDRNRNIDYGSSPYDRPRSRYRDDYDDGYRPRAPRRDDRRRDDYDDYDDGYYDRRY